MADISIVINCETTGELLQHLSKIQEDILAKKKDSDTDVLTLANFYLDDDNCYGSHTVNINQE